MTSSVASLIRSAFGPDSPVQVVAGGAIAGPVDSPWRLVFSDEALSYLARRGGELGFARAYVSGALQIEGDLLGLLRARATGPTIRLGLRERLAFLRCVGVAPWRQPPPTPAEEVALAGTLARHDPRRDRRAISHHYDVGNDFYQLLLGPSMVYSCAVFEHADDSLETAQANKLELICRKLGLAPGMRLLDVGCGWAGLVLHAASRFGVDAVGITISESQAAFARARVAAAGLSGRVEIRLCDYRHLAEGETFDAVASVGMAEHVGRSRLDEYVGILHRSLAPHGRLLNHQIGLGPEKARPAGTRSAKLDRDGFANRYVFPDGELHDVGELIAVLQQHTFEVRHVESLREHYALTTRRWLERLEAEWDRAVALVGEARARVWRLYLAGASVNFELGPNQVHQILAVRTPTTGPARGDSRMPLRLHLEDRPLSVGAQRERANA